MELTPTRWQRLRKMIYRLFEVRAGRLCLKRFFPMDDHAVSRFLGGTTRHD